MTRTIDRLGVFLLAAALLLPVGDAPWYSFWREWTASLAAFLIVLAAINSIRERGLPLLFPVRSLAVVAVGLGFLCWVQFGVGLVPYRSDALLPSLYFIGFAACMLVAGSLPQPDRDALLDRVAAGLLLAALLSVPMAVLQWVGWLRLDLDMPVAGGRPVAHMEQANLLCSLMIQGGIGAWRLAARGRLSPRLAELLCVPILLTIVLTQSRVAWLAALVLVCIVIWRRRVLVWPRHGILLLVAMLLLVIGTVLLPWIDGQLGLKGAALSERISEGRRPTAWALFLDAALAHPWVGWGVLQNGTAQFALADHHPSLGYSFSSAHNIVLDLMVWFGIPVGMLAAAVLFWGLGRRLSRAPNAATLATAFGATALALHALVEFPLHYAYFLLPLGLYFGATTTQRDPGKSHIMRVPTNSRALIPALSVTSALALALLGREYIRITDVRPALWVDKETRHLVLGADFPVPEVLLLDQLRAYHALAALPLAPTVPTTELDAARIAMQRTPFSVSIERYALLAGINGRDADARDALRRVCKFETPRQCARSLYAWGIWRQQWQELPEVHESAPLD